MTKILTTHKGRVREAIESAQENIHYELHNLKAFRDNVRASTRMQKVKKDWEMVAKDRGQT